MPSPSQTGTSRIRIEPRGLRIPSIELVVIDGPARGTRARVADGVARVGSAPGSDLSLADNTVSRVHCELRVHPDGIALRDCGSTNGTYVEGVRLREGEVQPLSLIHI